MSSVINRYPVKVSMQAVVDRAIDVEKFELGLDVGIGLHQCHGHCVVSWLGEQLRCQLIVVDESVRMERTQAVQLVDEVAELQQGIGQPSAVQFDAHVVQ